MSRNPDDLNVNRLLALMAAVVSFVAAAGLAVVLLLKAPLPAPGEPLFDTPTLIVAISDGCGWCDRFRDELDPQYRNSDFESRAPLRYVDAGELMRDPSYRLKSGIRGTPTLIMADTYGREVGRYAGYPGDYDTLASQVERMLKRVK